MRYLYYKLWQDFKRVKTNDMPATNAMIFISIIQFLNLSLIYIFIKHYFLVVINFTSKDEIYIFSILLGGIIYIINYFFLYKNRTRLYEKYKNENERSRITGNILSVLYIFGSFVLFFYSLSNFT